MTQAVVPVTCYIVWDPKVYQMISPVSVMGVFDTVPPVPAVEAAAAWLIATPAGGEVHQ
jgi:hypothetical protein